MTKKYMMLSLEEKESKSLAQVLSNDKSREILKYLTEHDKSTETDVAKALDFPLSTVHYNIQNLVKSKLVKPVEFHYSKKGKEVYHYSMANKIIVIAPSSQEKSNILKRLIPSLATIGVLATLGGVISSFSNSVKMTTLDAAPTLMRVAEEKTIESMPLIVDQGIKRGFSLASVNPTLAFILGAILGIVIFLFWEFIIKKK
jgi:predicted transcriptional regulator